MLPGPIFAFELVTTARRSRFYFVRVFYAVILFVILWTVHSAWTTEYRGELPFKLMSWFAVSTFSAITVGQVVLVLILTPALVAGVIADEKQRKTLHYLMASQLTGFEIVVGKLLVRMLYVAVLLGVSLPILSLLVLLGGIDPALVVAACVATMSTAWFLATLSIWVSTIARRPREALFITFGLECLWLFVPALTARIALGWPIVDQLLVNIHSWVSATSPVEVGTQLFWGVVRGTSTRQSEVELVCWMSGLQAVCGFVLAALAAVQLRPIFRYQEGGGTVRPRRGILAVLNASRFARRPPLGDRPMLWKELHTGGARGFARLMGLLLTAIGGGFLAYYSVWYGSAAVLEWREQGYGPWVAWRTSSARWEFYIFISVIAPLLYLVGLLSVAGSAAASITAEHEGDTWVSLTSTDLTAREIVLAKLASALKRGRLFAELILILVAAGAATGSIHPLSLPAMIVALLIYGWFAAALGIWISLKLRSTWRAQFMTVASLLLINIAGQGILNVIATRGFAPLLWPGFTPYEITKLVFEPMFLRSLSDSSWLRPLNIRDIDDGLAWQTRFSVASLVAYATFAAILTWRSLRGFETVAGRARRSALPKPAQAIASQNVDVRPAKTELEKVSAVASRV